MTLDMELKAGRKELRKEQEEMRLMCAYLGHTIHKVKTWKRWVELREAVK